MDRREFLVGTGAAAALAALPLAAPRPGCRRRVSRRRPHLGRRAGRDRRVGRAGAGRFVPSRQADRGRSRQRRIDLVSMTLGEVGNGPDRFRSAVQRHRLHGTASLAEHAVACSSRSTSAADIRAARAAGKVGLIYNFQDTTMLEGEASRVATFAALGAASRSSSPTTSATSPATAASSGPMPASPISAGEVIAEIERGEVLLDLSHSGQRTIAEGIAAASGRSAITHSGCREPRRPAAQQV